MSISDGHVVLQGATSATEVYLIDSDFVLRQHALQRLEATVKPGVYKARFQLGGEIQDRLFELESGGEVRIDGEAQAVVSVAPLEWTRWPGAPPPDLGRLWGAAARLPPSDGGGVLSVLWRCDGETPSLPPLELSTPGQPGQRPLDFEDVAGWKVAALRLPPGTHVLALAEGQDRLRRSVPIAAGQHTVLAMHAPAGAAGWKLTSVLRSALLMTAFPAAADREELLRQVVAQQALERSRALEWPQAGSEPATRSPLALLLQAHGVLEARRANLSHPLDPLQLGPEDREAVRRAYRELQQTELSGFADVAALALALEEPAPPVNLDVPPLLASTWRTLVTVSLLGQGRIGGGLPALRMAEGLEASSLWLTWTDRAPAGTASCPAPELSAAALDLLEPELRPSTGRLPSWVEAPDLMGLAGHRAGRLAKGLQLPLPLIQELVRNLEDERADARRARASRRIEALRSGAAKVCLVVLPDGVRVDPTRGQPIDLDAVADELVGGAAERAGLVTVRAPPLGTEAAEMQEALSRADLLVIDGTFKDEQVGAAAGFWQARRAPAAPLLFIQAEGQPALQRPRGAQAFTYSATFGTGLRFADPDGLARELARAASAAPPDGDAERAAWQRKLARIEERHLELRDLAALVRDLRSQKKPGEALAHLRRALPPEVVRAEAASLQRDAFLLFRAAESWEGMVATAEAMDAGLRSAPLVREQLALALKWSGREDALGEGIRILQEVIAEIGTNGETCGLLGGLCKKIWLERRSEPGGALPWLEEAIRWYRTGLESSPLDPYPGVNLLTLLAARGTPEALAEHAQRLPQVEQAISRRLYQRPSYWDLASMLEVAASKRDQKTCEWYLRLARAAPHDGWQGKATAGNLDILRGASPADLQWLGSISADLLA